MIMGTTTWQKAVRQLSQTALSDLLNYAEKSLEAAVKSEAGKVLAAVTGAGERQAADSAGQAAGLAEMAANAMKAIDIEAAKAAASVYASVSAIPVVGWILAPPAAAGAFAAVAAYDALVSAAGGMWTVPNDMVAMVHSQESILPANVAQPMRDFFSGSASSGGGGDSYAITIQAIDTQSGAQFLMNNSNVIAQTLARELRNANPSLRAALR